MKILLILLLFPVMCCGQKKDSIVIQLGTTGQNTVITGGSIYQLWVTPAKRQTTFTITSDTSKVVMLVCDTSIRFDNLSGRYTPYGNVWWQFGYAITIFHEGETDDGHHWPRETEIYLDENKKPLPKSVIVWQTKKINQ